MTKNLWGDLTDVATTLPRSPAQILREQAELFNEAIGGDLTAKVYHMADSPAANFVYDLDIVAPSLNNYHYTVVQIRHDVELYPVKLYPARGHHTIECEDEDRFVEELQKHLTSPPVKRVIANLLSQVRS